MPLNSSAELIAGRAASYRLSYTRQSTSTASSAVWSNWRGSAAYSPQGTTPTAAATCGRLTSGSVIRYIVPPNSPAKVYLDAWNMSGFPHTYVMYDRLAHMGGLSGTSVASQTVNVTLPTDANRVDQTGDGVEWFLEWYTATGSTAVTATITYTNQAGTSGQTTTVSLSASMAISRCLPIPLGGTDTAIKSIQSLQLSATTGTAGNFGVTARKRMAALVSNVSYTQTPADLTGLLIPVPDDCCIEFLMESAAGGGSAHITGNVSFFYA